MPNTGGNGRASTYMSYVWMCKYVFACITVVLVVVFVVIVMELRGGGDGGERRLRA